MLSWGWPGKAFIVGIASLGKANSPGHAHTLRNSDWNREEALSEPPWRNPTMRSTAGGINQTCSYS